MGRKSRTQLVETIPLVKGVHAFPIVHGSVEYTTFLREYFLATPPAMVALELPENLSVPIYKVIRYADAIPVITLKNPERKNDVHFIMEPLEPIVEALRSAHQLKIPCHLIDAYNDHFLTWVPESFPDTYSLRITGTLHMFQEYLAGKKRPDRDAPADEAEAFLANPFDAYRELFMARNIRLLSRFVKSDNVQDSLLVVCGIGHVEAIQKYLLMDERAFDALWKEVESAFKGQLPSSDDPDSDEEPLEALLKRNQRLVEEDIGAQKGLEYDLSILSRETGEVLSQPGYFNTAWSFARRDLKSVKLFNRLILHRHVYKDSVQRYEMESGEWIPPRRERQFYYFARNWSIVENQLLPDMYRLVMSGRAFANDHFARIMYVILNFLPPTKGVPFPEKKITLDEIFKDSRLVRFRMKLKKKRRVPPPKITKRFKRERYPGEWEESTDVAGICSYPPEDIFIEDFSNYLRKNVKTMLKGLEERTLPFSSSLLDGIDYRETIRNYHLGQIFVKDVHNRGVDVGAVVIIFSESEEDHPWKVVWWGEHSQESDMALYATYPADKLVGPGIFRCSYGGLLMTYPPGRLHDIWTNDDYLEFENPADRLLEAAIDYNDKNTIIHLSERPPGARLHALAGRVGQRIVHIPISTIDPVRLGRVRRFHVLDSKERRDIADDYIW